MQPPLPSRRHSSGCAGRHPYMLGVGIFSTVHIAHSWGLMREPAGDRGAQSIAPSASVLNADPFHRLRTRYGGSLATLLHRPG
ncbi:hypothetical protein GHK51_26700 [Sinorhizobium meliloti]|nr:hypothetical protein [Sinorhizobium meliloti]